MRTIISKVRHNLSAAMRQTLEDCIPIIITQGNGEIRKVMSLDEYHSRKETDYLMQSPENAKRLVEALAGLRAGKGVQRNLME